MANFTKRVRAGFRALGMSVALLGLTLLSYLAPSYSNWMKRLFTVLVVYHELQRRDLFRKTTLTMVNDNILRFQDQSLLNTVSSIVSETDLKCDLSKSGVDLDKIRMSGGLDPCEAREVSKLLIAKIPPQLHYGEQPMTLDITRMLQQSSG